MTTEPILGVVLGLRAALVGRFCLPLGRGVSSNPVNQFDPARAMRGGGLHVFRDERS